MTYNDSIPYDISIVSCRLSGVSSRGRIVFVFIARPLVAPGINPEIKISLYVRPPNVDRQEQMFEHQVIRRDYIYPCLK